MARCPTCGTEVANYFEHVDLDHCASMSDAPRDGTLVLGLYGTDRWNVLWVENRSHPGGGLSLGAGWVDEEGHPMEEPDAWSPTIDEG